MSTTKQRRASRKGQRLLDRLYAKKGPSVQVGMDPRGLVAYRKSILDGVEKHLSAIVADIQEYDPAPGKRRGELFRLVGSVAGELVQADDLFRVLAAVEKIDPVGEGC